MASRFRNPFDLAFRIVSCVLLASENGTDDNDELNLIMKGGNYIWPPSGFQNKADRIDPIAATDPVMSATGTEFSQATQITEWTNDFFYCTFHRGEWRRVYLAPHTFDGIVFEEAVTRGCTLDLTVGPDGALCL